MSAGDFTQIAILVVLFGTLIAIWRSMVVQNRLFAAQLLRDRFEMYRWTYEPVTSEDVQEFEVYPYDYVDKSKYDTYYRGNDAAIRRYIGMSQVYEYLAFTHALRRQKLPDPLGYHWTEQWIRDLLGVREFLDVHEYYRKYYPDFHGIEESLRNEPVAPDRIG